MVLIIGNTSTKNLNDSLSLILRRIGFGFPTDVKIFVFEFALFLLELKDNIYCKALVFLNS